MNGFESLQSNNFAPFSLHAENDLNNNMQSTNVNSGTFNTLHQYIDDLNPVPYIENKFGDVYRKITKFNPLDKLQHTDFSPYYASSENDNKLRQEMSGTFSTDEIEKEVNVIKNKVIEITEDIINPNTKYYFIVAFLFIIVILFYCKK